MPRDYKSRANPPSQKRVPTPGWVWFVAGLLVGGFVSGLAWLKLGPESPLTAARTPAAAEQTAPERPKPATTAEQSEAPKPRFDFYTILPEMEVVVSESDEGAAAPEQPAAGAAEESTPLTDAASYMVQMGSFRRYEDADRLKASLALMGVEAEIQRVTVQNGEVFHRVRSLPMSRGEANRLRARLQEQKINSLVVRLRT